MNLLRTLSRTKIKVFFNIIIFVVIIFTVQLAVGYFLFRESSFNQVEQSLSRLNSRIQQDLVYENGKWNTQLYLADPQTPHPNGSSGFQTPLYILTTDGFVIERNLPINGLLDLSDFKHLLQFTNIRYISGTTNEIWRVLSKPLIYDGETKGVIIVSEYNPSTRDTEEIDQRLRDTIDLIASKVTYKNGSLNISGVDIRNIHYEVSFEIVDQYNKVLLNNGRTPSFIDPSYVHEELPQKNSIIRDKITNQPFYVKSQALLDKSGKPKGVIVAAKPLDDLYNTLTKYVLLSTIFEIIIVLPVSFLLYFLLKSRVPLIMHDYLTEQKQKNEPHHISFNKEGSYIEIDNKKTIIPYATNQYYLCEAIFSDASKRWNQDELIERFGERVEKNNWRKIYDAYLTVNKKVSLKLIDYQDKIYRINPELVSKISVE